MYNGACIQSIISMGYKRKQSDGTTGERIAEIFFRDIGLKMFRHQPSTKVVKIRGKLFVVYERSDGIADYTGYDDSVYNRFVACEVKECKGVSMPCSRLEENQRNWLSRLPEKSAYVGVCWMTSPITFEMFRFKPRGSYKKGAGVRSREY